MAQVNYKKQCFAMANALVKIKFVLSTDEKFSRQVQIAEEVLENFFKETSSISYQNEMQDALDI